MTTTNFPEVLRPIIEHGFLEREFEQALRVRSGFRACAERVAIAAGIGETITVERHKSSERYTLAVEHYAATTDLNLVVARVGIASQFLQNAYTNGEQAGRSLDELSRNCLYRACTAHGATIRSGARSDAAALTAADALKMSDLLSVVAKLRSAATPEIDGAYNCYLDPISARQLFADPDFRQLFQGATSANQIFRKGMTSDFLGLRFMPTTEAHIEPHPTLTGMMIRRPIVCGRGALIEGDFTGMAAADVAPPDALVSVVDGVAMVTREAVDRLQQIIAQSWYWIGGFGAVLDVADGKTSFRRAIVVEHIG